MPAVNFGYSASGNATLFEATFASGMHGFVSSDGFTTLTRTQAEAYNGDAGILGSQSQGGSSTDSWSLHVATNAALSQTSVTLHSTQQVRVWPGSTTWIMAMGREANVFRDTGMVLAMDFFTQDGTPITRPTFSYNGAGGMNDSTWTHYQASCTVPSNAYTARAVVIFASTLLINFNTSDRWYLDWVGIVGPDDTNRGKPQSWTVPEGITEVIITCKGAAGGGFQNFNNTQGNKGGLARGTFVVTPGETLWVYVGGAGNAPTVLDGSYGEGYFVRGGWNGGGDAGKWWRFATPSNGGGGATDVRRGGQALANRIIVAGGGGGSRGDGGPAGPGGGENGGYLLYPGEGGTWSGHNAGKGGTQTAGGQGAANSMGSAENGALGEGGDGANQTVPDSFWGIAFPGGGGGGGGYYGGGGGAPGTSGSNDGWPGGGGSSWIHPDATNVTNSIAAGADGAIGGPTSSGHGSVVISWSVDPTDWSDPIADITSNSIPKGRLQRVGTGLWQQAFPDFWAQFSNAMVLGNGEYYLSVGYHGQIGKSNDLRRWRYTRLQGTGMNSTVLGWDGAHWCVAGWDVSPANPNGSIRTAVSSDGETWTLGPLQFAWSDHFYPTILLAGAGQWVMADYVGGIYSSSDGLTWTQRVTKAQMDSFTASVGDTASTGIQWGDNGQRGSGAYIPGKGFCILGRSRNASNSGWPYYAFSPDGVTWSYGRMKPDNSSLAIWDNTFNQVMLKMAGSGNEWVASGYFIAPQGGSEYRPIVLRSTNGTSWQFIDMGPDPKWQGFSNSQITDLFWTGTVFLMTSTAWFNNGTSYPEVTSPDGLQWATVNAHNVPSPTRPSTDFVWGGSIFVRMNNTAREDHPWRIERWAGHPERARPQDGPQPVGVRFVNLMGVDYDRANRRIIAFDKMTVGWTPSSDRYNPFHRFVSLDGKDGVTIANVPYDTVISEATASGTFNTAGTGSLRLRDPYQFKVSPDGRYIFVLVPCESSNSFASHIVRMDLETGTALKVAGQAVGGTNTGVVEGYPNESVIGRVSQMGLIGFHSTDGHLYMTGVYSTFDNVVARLEGWDTATPFFRVVQFGGMIGDGLIAGTPLSLRNGCFLGETIYALDTLSYQLVRIDPPYTSAEVIGDDGPANGSITNRWFDTPAHMISMNKKLYICEMRGQVVEWDPEDPLGMRVIAGDGDNLNGAETIEQWNDGDALETSMATCWSITTDGSSLYVSDGGGAPTASMQQVQRIAQGTGIPPLRLRQRDDNPR